MRSPHDHHNDHENDNDNDNSHERSHEHGHRAGFGTGSAPGFGPGRGFGPGKGFGPGRGFGPGMGFRMMGMAGGRPGDEPDGEDAGFGRGGRRGSGPRGFGPRGFGAGGPGGFGPGGFGPGGFGPGGFGHHRGGRGGRGRGNVRAAVLALLAEEPRHGYALMTELTNRSGGLWKPSPGSIYPVLQQLQDEELVSSEEGSGRKVFALTEAGRSYVTEHADELREPWKVAEHGPKVRVQSLMQSLRTLAEAVEQVARLSDDGQAARAVTVLEDARRSMYRILAEEGDRSPVSEPAAGPQADRSPE